MKAKQEVGCVSGDSDRNVDYHVMIDISSKCVQNISEKVTKRELQEGK